MKNNESDRHVKQPLFLSDFNKTWIFTTFFSKNTKILTFMKLLWVGAESFHADKRADMTKLIVAFRNFANAHKNLSVTKELCENKVFRTHV
jgi:hypothetical protein